MKLPAVPAAASHTLTREGNRGDSDDGLHSLSYCLIAVAKSAIYGSANAKTNMVCAGRQADIHIKKEKRERNGDLQNRSK